MTKSSKKSRVAVPRIKKAPAYRSFRLNSRIEPERVKQLPSVRALWRDTYLFLWKYKKHMLMFVLVYASAYLVLVKGIGNFGNDTVGLREELRDIGGTNIDQFFGVMLIFGSLLTSLSVDSDDMTNLIQVIILTLCSLAYIWLVRKLHAGRGRVTVKDAFYKGPRPLIPFLIVNVIMGFAFLPAALTTLTYATAQTAVSASDTEVLGVMVVMILGVVLSLYLFAGMIFAPYIVTLPDMTPTRALRASLKLLRIHRWAILKKLVALAIILLVIGFVLTFPFIMWLARYAEVAFFVYAALAFASAHTYLYKLYRSML